MKTILQQCFIFFVILFSGGQRAYAATLTPPISIYMAVTDQFRDHYSGKLSDGGIPFVSTSIQRRSDSPVLDTKVDIYFGMVKPDGAVFSWVPVVPNAFGVATELVSGFKPIGLNMQLDTSLSNSDFLTNTNRFISYQFTKDDVAGLYMFFTLVVGTGKDPNDPSNWITSKNKIFPIKP